MAAKTDLTFGELLASLPAGSVVDAGGDVQISVNSLIGNTATAMTDGGVAEALFRLLDGAATAQAEANDGLLPEETLKSFNTPSYEPLVNGASVVSTRMSVSIPLAVNDIRGVN